MTRDRIYIQKCYGVKDKKSGFVLNHLSYLPGVFPYDGKTYCWIATKKTKKGKIAMLEINGKFTKREAIQIARKSLK